MFLWNERGVIALSSRQLPHPACVEQFDSFLNQRFVLKIVIKANLLRPQNLGNEFFIHVLSFKIQSLPVISCSRVLNEFGDLLANKMSIAASLPKRRTEFKNRVL